MSASAHGRLIVVLNLNPSATTRAGTRRIVRALQRLSPTRVVERHFLRIESGDLADASAVVLGPQGVPFDAYPAPHREHLFGLIRELTDSGPPVLGICGGHQALVLALGGAIGPVHGGVATGSYAGHRKEAGLRHVQANGPVEDPVVLSGDYVVSHVEGVTALPAGLECVGAGDPCAIQAVRRPGRPVWGVQFHPERGADGTELLRRFLALVRD